MLLKSKKGQFDSNLQMATLYQKIGQVVKAVGHMKIVKELMNEIGCPKTVMYEMKNGGAEVSTDTPEVSMFLEKGREAMGIASNSNGKAKLKTSKSKKNQNDAVVNTVVASNGPSPGELVLVYREAT